MPYQKMYAILFRAATDALEAIRAQNYGIAADILMTAQCESEEIFICAEESGEESEKPL